MQLTTSDGGNFVGLAGAARAALLVELGALDDQALGLPVPLDRERLGEEIEHHRLGLVGPHVVEFAQDRDRFALAGLERVVGLDAAGSR